MKILIACEFSGVLRDAFIAKGHDARYANVSAEHTNLTPMSIDDLRIKYDKI